MEGIVQYEGSGDVFFAFYNGEQQLDEMPKKGVGLYFERADCNNEASVEWDNASWAPKVLNITKTKTKCTLYFTEKDYGQIESLKEKNPSMFAYDDTSEQNLRYIGKEVNNYIDIGDKDSNGNKILWRIIGAMKNIPVVDEYGEISNTENLVKIIRADSIGKWSWDTSASGVNYGWGVNEWSQADIMTTLNSGTYWSKTSGQCYNAIKDKQTTCDFSSIGLTKEAKKKLAKVRWNTGTSGEVYDSSKITASYMYEAERSNHNGKKQCLDTGGGTYSGCNDQVERETTWDGFIGLMYPSDYGYAVGGSVRSECLAKTMWLWDESSPDCKNNDWLYDSSNSQYTLTPVPYSSDAVNVFYVYSDGNVRISYAYSANAVRPVAYLKPSIKIQEKTGSDYGSKSNPFVIEGVS